MIVCDICTGRHRTGACGRAAVFVEQCFAGTPDEFEPSTFIPPLRAVDLDDVFAYRRRRVEADRAAWEAERLERRRAGARNRARRLRSGLRLVS